MSKYCKCWPKGIPSGYEIVVCGKCTRCGLLIRPKQKDIPSDISYLSEEAIQEMYGGKAMMKKKTRVKWNYAVMSSVFGNLWVGKTKLSPKKERVFKDIEEAKEKARMLFQDYHPDFDSEDEDNNDMEVQSEYDNIDTMTEDTAEEIRKGMEKFIQ